MTNLINGERIRQAVVDQTFIKNGDPASVENFKYDFRMGDQVLKASFGQPMALGEVPQEKRFVDPGEAVFVLTKEQLDLPNNMIATLSPKRKLSHGGILVLGGFDIDPSYKGHLLLGLYNFSSTPYPLRAGKKIIAALFYEFAAKDNVGSEIVPQQIDDFPDELVSLIRSYHPIELNSLSEALADLKRDFSNLKSEVTSDKTWRDEFKLSLEQHNDQLGKLIDSLKEEREARVSEDEKIKTKLESMSNMFMGWRWGWVAVSVIITIILGAVIGHFVTKWLT